MDLYSLPKTLTLNGQSFRIVDDGDYRAILDCMQTLEDSSLSRQERPVACLLMFFEDVNTPADLKKLGDLEVALKAVYKFINCGQDEHPGVQNFKVMDWESDAQMIASAINKVAGFDVRTPDRYAHWWTFMGWFSAIGESTFSTVVNIRTKIKEGKKLEKWEKDFKRNNPHYFNWNSKTTEETELDEWVRTQLWNSN